MTKTDTYLIFPGATEEKRLLGQLTADEARDEYFEADSLSIEIAHEEYYALDDRYEAPLYRDGEFHILFTKEF